MVTANEQAVHRWLAQNTRARLTAEAVWPSREEPVGRVRLKGDLLAGRGPVDVRAARVVLRRAHEFAGQRSNKGRSVRSNCCTGGNRSSNRPDQQNRRSGRLARRFEDCHALHVRRHRKHVA